MKLQTSTRSGNNKYATQKKQLNHIRLIYSRHSNIQCCIAFYFVVQFCGHVVQFWYICTTDN